MRTKATKIYHAMIQRIETNINYKDYQVCDEWIENKEAFITWYIDNYKPGYQIDKDLLANPNKLYSPETCMMVPVKINQAFRSKKTNSRGNSSNTTVLPMGVSKSYNNKTNAYQSHCNKKNLGQFNDVMAAHKQWQLGKIQQLTELAIEFPDFSTLINVHIEVLKNDINNNQETKW